MDDEDEDVGDRTANARGSRNSDGGSAGPSGDAGGSTTQDAGPTTVAPTPPAAIPGTSVPAAVCAAPLASASAACAAPDLFEPNDKAESAIPLDTSTSCALVPGKLSNRSEYDYYSFSSPRRDPVRVQLGYEAAPSSGSDLGLRVEDATGSSAVSLDDTREDLTWFLDGRFVAKKGVTYTAWVLDRKQGNCQGYNLLVDTSYCTDAFEDNDTEETAAKGLAYGTTITATSFRDDYDYYDLSAIQAAGAACTVTTDLNLNSPQRVGFRVSTSSGNGLGSEDLDGTSGTNTATLTIKAGSGASLLQVLTYFSDECTHYTLVCNPL